MRRAVISWFLFVLCLMLAINLFRSWRHLSTRGDVIQKAKDRLQEQKDLQDNLVRKLAGIQSQEFVEKQAREKLNLGREGEIVVLLPSISPILEPTPTPQDTSSNFEKWLKLFL